jgi:predicted MFS family arabinose efflux permease
MRALTGVSVGGTVPLLFSLLGDLVPPSRRSAVAAGVGIAQGAGVAMGQIVAGSLGARNVDDAWRLPFAVVAVPALVLALCVALCEEPRRGGQEPALAGVGHSAPEYRERIEWRKVRHIFRIRTNLLAFAQGVPGCVPWGVMNTYFTDYMAVDKGLGVERATSVVVLFGIGCVAGNVAGGLGGQSLYNRSPGTLGTLMGVTTLAGALPLLGCVALPAGSGESVLVFLAGALLCVTGTNIKAVLLGVNTPETRGTCFAIFSLADSLGKGLGPAAVAALIQRIGRAYAFNVAICMYFPCGALLLGIASTLNDDEKQMQAQLRASAIAQTTGVGDIELHPLLIDVEDS